MPTVTPLLPTQPPRTRTRTPPAIKWLLNERAALAGAQQSTQDAIPRLQHQVELALANLARAEHELAVAEKALELGSKKLQALDSTLAQVNSAVEPHAGGVIKAWQGRYGERGALTKLLLELLQSAAPSPMALHQIVDHVELHFGIHHAIPESRKKLRYSIRTRLRDLQAKTGKVAPHRPTPGHPVGYPSQMSVACQEKLEP